MRHWNQSGRVCITICERDRDISVQIYLSRYNFSVYVIFIEQKFSYVLVFFEIWYQHTSVTIKSQLRLLIARAKPTYMNT